MYCSWPFTQFFIDEVGDATTCCPNWTSVKLGNVLKTPPMEIWRGEAIARFRQSIVDQSFRYCVNCGNPETLVEPDFPEVPEDLEVVKKLLLAYDPTCNLRCPSCRREHRRPGELAAKIHEVVLSSGVLRYSLGLDLSGDGEAMASSLYWSLLTSKVECHPAMSVNLRTNGLLLTRDRLQRIEDSGKRVGTIGVSIDAATRETYALNRGGDWDVLMSNLEAARDYPCWKQFNYVVQANNFREMRQFVELSARLGASSIFFSALVNWGTYSEQDYLVRAVHLPSHPQYGELKAVLEDPAFSRREVILAQLPAFRPGHVHDHRKSSDWKFERGP